MLPLAIMSIVIIISILQVFHHMGYLENALQEITHVTHMLTNELWQADTQRVKFIRSLRNDQMDAMLPCWEIEGPCWPEDEPKSPDENLNATQAVVQATGPWYMPLLYVYYAWKSAVSALPVLIVIGVIPFVAYVVYSGIAVSLCPGVVDSHLRDLQNFLVSSQRDIEDRASQTSKDLVRDVYRNLELQESRSLEVIMDILNEMNDGLTMQQWYEQQKLNHMMEDDLRAAQLASRHRRRTGELSCGLRDLRRVTDKRSERLSALQESQQRARHAFSRCMDLLGELQEVHNAYAETVAKEERSQASGLATDNFNAQRVRS